MARTTMHPKEEHSAGYDVWLKKQVQAALDDTYLNKSHEAVMEQAKIVLDKLLRNKVE